VVVAYMNGFVFNMNCHFLPFAWLICLCYRHIQGAF